MCSAIGVTGMTRNRRKRGEKTKQRKLKGAAVRRDHEENVRKRMEGSGGQ